jgi:hypothetical protein
MTDIEDQRHNNIHPETMILIGRIRLRKRSSFSSCFLLVRRDPRMCERVYGGSKKFAMKSDGIIDGI